MAKYYLIYGDSIRQEIVSDSRDITALPLLDDKNAASLINQKHIVALINWIRNHGYPNATAATVIQALGLVHERNQSL